MHRKEFIKTCCMVSLGGTALAMFLESCGSTNYFAQSTIEKNILIIKKTEFVKTVHEKSLERKYVMVKTEKLNYPICIYKIGEENYSALLMECSHKGCELQPNGNHLICPCHGSEFTNKGVVQNPPAEANLKSFTITTDTKNVYVQL
jgi:Rieske Fe-S protein